MKPVQFGQNPSASKLYQCAKWAYEGLPEQVERGVKAVFGQGVAQFFKQQLQSDFSHFTGLDIGGRFRALIAEPPRLPVLFLLYPATVGPRLYRAYQRGKENNDFREMGDVLRRDLTAITLFVFALTPLVKLTNRLMTNLTGVNLLDEKSKTSLSYGQFQNYEIDSPKALAQVIKEGNGQGLVNAVNKLTDGNLHQHGQTALKETLEGLKDEVQKLVTDYEKNPKADHLSRATEVYKHYFVAAENHINKALNHPDRSVMDIASGLRGQVKDVLKNYAKVRRLPADIASFGMVIGLIGWFPVWFNSQWNKHQFEKKNAVKSKDMQPNPWGSAAMNASPTSVPVLPQSKAVLGNPATNSPANPITTRYPFAPATNNPYAASFFMGR